MIIELQFLSIKTPTTTKSLKFDSSGTHSLHMFKISHRTYNFSKPWNIMRTLMYHAAIQCDVKKNWRGEVENKRRTRIIKRGRNKQKKLCLHTISWAEGKNGIQILTSHLVRFTAISIRQNRITDIVSILAAFIKLGN